VQVAALFYLGLASFQPPIRYAKMLVAHRDVANVIACLKADPKP
jgi:hypothetical protein